MLLPLNMANRKCLTSLIFNVGRYIRWYWCQVNRVGSFDVCENYWWKCASSEHQTKIYSFILICHIQWFLLPLTCFRAIHVLSIDFCCCIVMFFLSRTTHNSELTISTYSSSTNSYLYINMCVHLERIYTLITYILLLLASLLKNISVGKNKFIIYIS